MEQFRHIGEVLGSLKAWMVFQNDIPINQRQCTFLVDILTSAYETIADGMRSNLRFEDKHSKWKVLEQPLKDTYRVFREAVVYIRHCFENKDWSAKVITLYQNKDCVEFHIHNLLICVPIVVEAIETLSTKYSQQLMNVFLNNLDEAGSPTGKLLPCSILTGSKHYQVRRRLGNGGQYKEISWLGENFVVRHIKGDTESLIPEISELSSLSHPNILQILCGFRDDEKRECFLVTELMSKNLSIHLKEFHSPKKRISLSLPVAVDLMLQIARGMEYLHSKKIYHGDLNPSNILIKPRGCSSEGFLLAKVAGFGLSSVTNSSQKLSNPQETLSFIWYAPEVLELQEESKCTTSAKYTEKSDVYSFGMISFELLTGKIPFEDAHLQGDKMSRNIRAGERPLFPFHCPKYVINLTKKCWHSDPHQRPSFTSICRILRYIKRFLAMNPEPSQPDAPPMPQVDYCDIESGLLKRFPSWTCNDPLPPNLEVREHQCREMSMEPQQMIHF